MKSLFKAIQIISRGYRTLAMEIAYLVDEYCRSTLRDCREKSTTKNVETRNSTLFCFNTNSKVL